MKTLIQPLALAGLLATLLSADPVAAQSAPPRLSTLAASSIEGARQTYTVAYRYDAQGRLTDAIYDDAFTISYTYDAAGNLTAIAAAPGVPIAVEEEPGLPLRFALHASYPNPFNPTATIPFDVQAPVRVVLTVYDVLGREVATVVDKAYAPGRHTTVFEARHLSSGVYFFMIQMGAFRDVEKMVLVR